MTTCLTGHLEFTTAPMRFDPAACPDCGAPAVCIYELIPGWAGLHTHDDGTADYGGETRSSGTSSRPSWTTKAASG